MYLRRVATSASLATVTLGLLLAAALSLSACGSSGSGSSASETDTPKQGGELVIAWDSEPQTLDPAVAWNLIDWQIEHGIFGTLYGYASKPGDSGTQLEPLLAESMPEVSADGKTYTIKLKQGVKFQPPVDREVTAEDWKYSFERMMKLPRAPATYFYTDVVGAEEFQAGEADHISGVKVVDPYTLEIDLGSPNIAFLNMISMYFCSVTPKEWVEKWGDDKIGRHPLGTGPFMFDHWTPGQEIVLKRNPNYAGGTVWLDSIKFGLSDNAQTAFLRLQRGEVDILGNNLPPSEIVSMQSNPDWKDNVYAQPMIATIYLSLNTQMKPLDDARVRRAISWAIDRDKLVRLLAGQATPLLQVYPPGMPGYQPDMQWYGHDPEKAKQLLVEAGFPDGFSTTLYSDNVDPYPKLFQSIQNDLEAVGIDADIKLMSNQTFYGFVTTPQKAEIARDLWYMDYPDPSDWMVMFLKASAVPGGLNQSFWWNADVERLYVEAQAMTDPTARLAKYDEIQKIIMEEAPVVTLYAPTMTTMCSERVGGFYLHLINTYDPVSYWLK